jgi:hypothetical protein
MDIFMHSSSRILPHRRSRHAHVHYHTEDAKDRALCGDSEVRIFSRGKFEMRTKPACLPSRSMRAIRVILSGFGQLLAGVKISTRRNLRTGRFEERPRPYLAQQRSPA